MKNKLDDLAIAIMGILAFHYGLMVGLVLMTEPLALVLSAVVLLCFWAAVRCGRLSANYKD